MKKSLPAAAVPPALPPPEHPAPPTAAEAKHADNPVTASNLTPGSSDGTLVSPTFTLKSPSGPVMIAKNPGLVKGLQRRQPTKSRTSKPAEPSPLLSPTEPAATGKSPMSRPLTGTTSLDPVSPEGQPAERRRRSSTRWGDAASGAESQGATRVAAPPTGRGTAEGNSPQEGRAERRTDRASPAAAGQAEGEGRHAHRVPSEDGEASPIHSPARDSRSQSAASDRPRSARADQHRTHRHDRSPADRHRSRRHRESGRDRDTARHRRHADSYSPLRDSRAARHDQDRPFRHRDMDRDEDLQRQRGSRHRDWDRDRHGDRSRGPGYAEPDEVPYRDPPQFQTRFDRPSRHHPGNIGPSPTRHDEPDADLWAAAEIRPAYGAEPDAFPAGRQRGRGPYRGGMREVYGRAHDRHPAPSWDFMHPEPMRSRPLPARRRSASFSSASPEPPRRRSTSSPVPHERRRSVSQRQERLDTYDRRSRSSTPAAAHQSMQPHHSGPVSPAYSPADVDMYPCEPVATEDTAHAPTSTSPAAGAVHLGQNWYAVRQPSPDADPERPIEAPPAPVHPTNEPELDDGEIGELGASQPGSPMQRDPASPSGTEVPLRPAHEFSPLTSDPASASSPATQPSQHVQDSASPAPAVLAAKRREAWLSKAGAKKSDNQPTAPNAAFIPAPHLQPPAAPPSPPSSMLPPPAPPGDPPAQQHAACNQQATPASFQAQHFTAPPYYKFNTQPDTRQHMHHALHAYPTAQRDSPYWAASPMSPVDQLWSPAREKQAAAERTYIDQPRLQLRQDMAAVRDHIQAMFLSLIPQCQASLPDFPVRQGQTEGLTWQQRAAAYKAQLDWHAPAMRSVPVDPDFSTNWDGDMNDPVSFPVAAGRRLNDLSEQEMALRQRLQDASRAPSVLPHDPDSWQLIEEGGHKVTPWEVFISRQALGITDPRPDPNILAGALPARLPVPRIAWGWPKDEEAPSETWDSVFVSWSDSPKASRGDEAQSRPGPPPPPLREPPAEPLSSPAAPALATGTGTSVRAMTQDNAGTTPSQLPDAAVSPFWNEAYRGVVEAQASILTAASSPAEDDPAGLARYGHTPVDQAAEEALFWQSPGSRAKTIAPAPHCAPPMRPASTLADASAEPTPSTHAAGADPVPIVQPAVAASQGQAASSVTPRPGRRRRFTAMPDDQAVAKARQHVCTNLIEHWRKSHATRFAATLIQEAFEVSYEPWQSRQEEQLRLEQEELDRQAAAEEAIREAARQTERQARQQAEEKAQERDRQQAEERAQQQAEEQARKERLQAQQEEENKAKAKAVQEEQRAASERRLRDERERAASEARLHSATARSENNTQRQAADQSAREQQSHSATDDGGLAARQQIAPLSPASAQVPKPNWPAEHDTHASLYSTPAPELSSENPPARPTLQHVPHTQQQNQLESASQPAAQTEHHPKPLDRQPGSLGRSRLSTETKPSRGESVIEDGDDDEYTPGGGPSKQRGASRGLKRASSSLGSRGRGGSMAKRARGATAKRKAALEADSDASDSEAGDGGARLGDEQEQLHMPPSSRAAATESMPSSAAAGRESSQNGKGHSDDSEDEEEEDRIRKQEALQQHNILECLNKVQEHMERHDEKNGGFFKSSVPAETRGRSKQGEYSQVIEHPMCLTAIRKRIPEGLISGKKRAKANQYAISLDGLAEFKRDLDLISSNCRQFWSTELKAPETAGDVEAGTLASELVQRAADFQEQLEQVYSEWHRKVASHEANMKK